MRDVGGPFHVPADMPSRQDEHNRESRSAEYECPSDDTLTKCKEVFNNAFPETISQNGAEVFKRNCAYDLCMMSEKGDAQVSIQLK